MICQEKNVDNILPGLVTLSSDPEIDVRIDSISGIARAMTLQNDLFKEKAGIQFFTFFEDHQGHFVYIKVVECLTSVWKDLNMKFREEKLIPKIVDLYKKYGSDEYVNLNMC